MTKLETMRIQNSREGCFGVNCQGLSGGLALLWKKRFHVLITSYFVGHIDTIVNFEGEFPFRLTGFIWSP